MNINKNRRLARLVAVSVVTSCLTASVWAAETPTDSGDQIAMVDASAQETKPDVWGLRHQAEMLIENGKLQEALGRYDQAIALDATHVLTWWARAVLNVKLGRLEAAVADFRRVLAIWPSEASVHGSLGLALIQLNRFAEGQRSLEIAHRLDPLSYSWSVYLGHAYLLQGDTRKAHQIYEKALTLIPDEEAFQSGPLVDFEQL